MKRGFRRLTLVVLAALLVGYSGTAGATLTSIDFSAISTQGQGYHGTTLGILAFTSEADYLYHTAKYGGGIYDGLGATGDMYMQFSAPINSISVRGGDGGGDDDAFSPIPEFSRDCSDRRSMGA